MYAFVLVALSRNPHTRRLVSQPPIPPSPLLHRSIRNVTEVTGDSRPLIHSEKGPIFFPLLPAPLVVFAPVYHFVKQHFNVSNSVDGIRVEFQINMPINFL